MKPTTLAAILFVTLATQPLDALAQASAGTKRAIAISETKTDWGVVKFEYYLGLRGRQVRHGAETEHDGAGKLMRKGSWKDGARDGVWETYRSDGTVRSRETYAAGRPTGTSQWWNDDRSLEFEKKFDEAGHITEESSFYPDGKPRRHGKYSPGAPGPGLFAPLVPKRVGTWTYWNRAGEKIAVGEFIDGKPWSGVCGVPAAGDAGSAGGLESFGRYDAGTLVEKVSLKH